MDVSNQKPMTHLDGRELVETVAELSGLPEDLAHEELGQIIESAGHSEGALTLEQLREAMIAYLESLHSEMTAEEPIS